MNVTVVQIIIAAFFATAGFYAGWTSENMKELWVKIFVLGTIHFAAQILILIAWGS